MGHYTAENTVFLLDYLLGLQQHKLNAKIENKLLMSVT